ncbi:MAG: hypothetical protein ACREJC_05465 [Tepidisphaeraceae bacterium]
MPEPNEPTARIDSPPPAPQPPLAPADEAPARLRRIATELMRRANRRLLIEYLALRRAVQ